MTKWLFFLIAFFSVNLNSYSQEQDNQLLNKAYQQNNDSLLKVFFHSWENDDSVNVSGSNNVFLEDINQLFKIIIDPENIHRISSASDLDSFYSNVKYFILQNKVVVHLVKADSLQRTGIYTDSLTENFVISNFRPSFEFKNKKVLYLTEKYEATLNQFLGKPGKNNYANNPKIKFISPYIKIIPETDKSWFFETRPVISDIYFNKSKKIARLDFRLFYQSGYAYFVKDYQEWKMIWSGLTE